MNVNDPKNDYYQPWQNDPAEQGSAAPRLDAGEGLAKPQDLPPVGMDLSRYADEEKMPREPLIDREKLKDNSAKMVQGARQTASRFAAWTIALGQKADIPTRLEKLEIPQKTKSLVKKSSAAAAEATRAAAKSTAKVSKASAEKSAEVWKKAALADKVSKLSSDAGRGFSEIADKTKTGLEQVAKAGKESIGEKAGKLRPAPRAEEDLTPPPSGLDQLLEREAEAQAVETAKSTAELPLFSEKEKAEVAQDVTAVEPAVEPAAPLVAEAPQQLESTPKPAAIAPTQQAPEPQQSAAPVTSAPKAEPQKELEPKSAPAPAPAPAPTQIHMPTAQAAAAAPEKTKVPPHHVVNHARSDAGYAAAPAAPAHALWRPSGAVLGMAAFGLAALLGASFYLGSQFGGGLSKGDVETIVGDYITNNPQIIPAALEAQRGREMAAAIDSVRPVLEKPYAGAWGGNANGDVTLVVFTDYACGFCRASVPDIDRLIREDKRLKVVYRELPIIARESRSAALMALLAARQGKYDAFHHAMFEQSSLSPTAIIAAAEKAGVTLDTATDSEAEEAVFQRELESNLAMATELQLNATPTWVIGDQLLQGQVGYAALQDAVAKARAKKAS